MNCKPRDLPQSTTLYDNKSTAIFHLIISSKLTAARRDSFSWVGRTRGMSECAGEERVCRGPRDKKRVEKLEEEKEREREREIGKRDSRSEKRSAKSHEFMGDINPGCRLARTTIFGSLCGRRPLWVVHAIQPSPIELEKTIPSTDETDDRRA